jgi:hypothetical protein
MRIQCSCGTKFELDVTPEMAHSGVKCVCPSCGLDASEFVTNLARQELAAAAAPEPSATIPAATPLPRPAAGPVRVNLPPRIPTPAVPVAPSQPEAAAAPQAEAQYCQRHADQIVVEKCYICSKPICLKCLELFGYVCSPLCKAKANSHGIKLPVYAGQRDLVEKRRWRTISRAASAIAVVCLLLGAFWFWYTFFGREPKPVFSVRFNDIAYAGQSFICAKDQIVFLHGGTLARHDMTKKQQIWSRELLDRSKFAAEAEQYVKRLQESARKRSDEDPDGFPMKIPSVGKVTKRLIESAEASLELRVAGRNIWVGTPEKLGLYDWDTGKLTREYAVRGGFEELISLGQEALLVDAASAVPTITHINLATGDVRSEDLAGTPVGNLLRPAQEAPQEMAGLPTGAPGEDAGKPLDPARVAADAQRLSYPARIALPAMLANSLNQERLLNELSDQSGKRAASPAGPKMDPGERLSLVPARNGCVQMSVKLLEERIVARNAMKAAPAKSALDGPVSVAQTTEIANEILNEMQRSRGGGMVHENLSRYQVKLRRPDGSEAWAGEVIGPPTLYPLDTVNVLAAGKKLLVFDKQHKKLWESTLTYDVSAGPGSLDPDNAPYGIGPCAQRNGSLYVFDAGVLTAFDLKTGDARWRLPSVGVMGLFFDDKDMIYINTTTADPESIKYSRQIDLSKKTDLIVHKVDSRDGHIVWTTDMTGPINYVSGKFIYTIQFFMPEEPDPDEDPFGAHADPTPPYMRIRRVSPRTGAEIWQHFQQRAPLDVQFDRNVIRLVFKKEVQVLKSLTF